MRIQKKSSLLQTGLWRQRLWGFRELIRRTRKTCHGTRGQGLPRFVCYPPYCFCNFPFPRMGCSLVGGKGKSCRREILCYGIKGWIRQPVDENRGSIISIRVLIFARSWTSWRDASATVLCQKTVQLSRQRDAESAKWVMTSHF